MFHSLGQAVRRLRSEASQQDTEERPDEAPTHSVHPGWPEATPSVRLPAAGRFTQVIDVRLRPLLRRDGRDWREIRLLDEPYLKPVEPTVPVSWEEAHTKTAWWSHYLSLRDAASQGLALPFVVEVNGAFAGQVTIGGVQHGAASECWIGYWVHSAVAGAGIATTACGLGVDHAFTRMGLHRVTATYLPDNPASGKVLAHNRFRREGYLRRNLNIDGEWRDHVFVAINREDYPTSCIERLREQERIL